MERAGWPNFVNVCANFCVLYVMRAVLKKGNWISLSSSCVEHGATAGDGC